MKWIWEYAPHIGRNLIVIRKGRRIVFRMNKTHEDEAAWVVKVLNEAEEENERKKTTSNNLD